MEYVQLKNEEGITVVTLQKGKVNQINEKVAEELTETFESLAGDDSAGAIVLTGNGKFFSFGLEVPELYHYSKEDFERFLIKFTNLYNVIFNHPKPVIAAVNGHAVAGGCMLAIACDYRIMTIGKAKISLNEVTFGSSVFAGSTEILKHVTGNRNAEEILFSGLMYTAEQAKQLGLVDEVIAEEEFSTRLMSLAKEFKAKDAVAYTSLKKLLRQDILEKIDNYEMDSIKEFINIWYSESTRAQLKKIVIN